MTATARKSIPLTPRTRTDSAAAQIKRQQLAGILQLLQSKGRVCDVEEVVQGCGLTRSHALKLLDELRDEGAVMKLGGAWRSGMVR
jgi:predicted transcriptional regulator